MVVVREFQESSQLNNSALNDMRLEEQLWEALHRMGILPNGSIQITVQDSTVTLSGEVASYYLKQLAQTVVLHNNNVNFLRNEIRVSKYIES
ncbi:BON domain-containing protein [Gimesia algae]|uniref:BON domain protein n=1 Tax=Gimesia algae TaxID=2527971 RepID=A0A517VEW3_9PLAN|nr:BON domain-containing protein [Gimesia algae]QDT91526.1 BON domain protein [Gimesia algae]